jgi:fluoride exporter
MFRNVLVVGFGSFLGGISRYLCYQVIQKLIFTNFPIGTLFINISGCFLIGILFGLFEKGNIMSADIRLFLTVGFCGSFTTFSSFSNDTINLVKDSEVLYLMIYMGISIFVGISVTYLGKFVVSYLWS